MFNGWCSMELVHTRSNESSSSKHSWIQSLERWRVRARKRASSLLPPAYSKLKERNALEKKARCKFVWRARKPFACSLDSSFLSLILSIIWHVLMMCVAVLMCVPFVYFGSLLTYFLLYALLFVTVVVVVVCCCHFLYF